ncbi:MAG: prolyl-tRNA synthetase associated domain-containing protein [Bacteroidetes bacterium]|nr:MAG: prolyl-tRNA synthetase associated domain-containing protein [Bacteroidota bacterium]
MRGQKELYTLFKELEIDLQYIEHPAVPTVEEAMKYWKGMDAVKCKNLFFRNHKGNRHFLVLLEHKQSLRIKDLEQILKQGKISFASEKRLDKYLKLTPGSVTPFGLINDSGNHVHVFIDKNLQNCGRISFHPNINTASIVVSFDDFIKFMDWTGNSYEFIELY